MARAIRVYWGMQGYEVRSWVQGTHDHDRRGLMYEVKTDLVNGLPRNWKGPFNSGKNSKIQGSSRRT